jgi:hypothetical protein
MTSMGRESVQCVQRGAGGRSPCGVGGSRFAQPTTFRWLLTTIWLSTALVASGCGKSDSAATPEAPQPSQYVPPKASEAAPPKPPQVEVPRQSDIDTGKPTQADLTHFTGFAERYLATYQASIRNDFARVGETTCELLSTDVKKTDSAISPYVFELVYKTCIKVEAEGKSMVALELQNREQFVRNSGVWVMVRAYCTTIVDPRSIVGEPGSYPVGLEREVAVNQSGALLAQMPQP